MKRTLKPSTRKICLLVLGLLLIGTVASLAWNTMGRAQEQKEEFIRYAYQEQSKLNYRVYLLPNQLFTEPSIGPGKVYLAHLTDRINTFFEYHFTGQEAADFNGSYEVHGWISAMNEVGNKSKTQQEVWRKDFTYVPPTPFSGHDLKVDLNQEVSIPYQSYRQFSEQVQEITKFVPDSIKLTVQYSVNLASKTSKGPLQDNFTSSITIPLNSAAFSVQGKLEQQKKDGIKGSAMVPVPGLKVLQMILAAFSALFLFLFLFMWLFIRSQEEFMSPSERQCTALLKKYGERIIILKEGLTVSAFDQMLPVHSFEDLLKAADDLAQPILMENADIDQYLFYVRDGNIIYRYTLDIPWFSPTFDEDITSVPTK